MQGYVPKLIWKDGTNTHEVLLMQYAGIDLLRFFPTQNYEYSCKLISIIGASCILALEHLHQLGFAHSNLSPSKLLIDTSNHTISLNIVGFSDAQEISNDIGLKELNGKDVGSYRDLLSPDSTDESVNEAPNKNDTINEFSSLDNHLGKYITRKDDLESLGYILLYFISKGTLFNFASSKKGADYIRAIKNWKESTPEELLYKGAPKMMIDYLKYVKKLHKNDTPKYEYLRNLILSFALLEGPPINLRSYSQTQYKPEQKSKIIDDDPIKALPLNTKRFSSSEIQDTNKSKQRTETKSLILEANSSQNPINFKPEKPEFTLTTSSIMKHIKPNPLSVIYEEKYEDSIRSDDTKSPRAYPHYKITKMNQKYTNLSYKMIRCRTTSIAKNIAHSLTDYGEDESDVPTECLTFKLSKLQKLNYSAFEYLLFKKFV